MPKELARGLRERRATTCRCDGRAWVAGQLAELRAENARLLLLLKLPGPRRCRLATLVGAVGADGVRFSILQRSLPQSACRPRGSA